MEEYNQVMTHATLFCQKINEAGRQKRKTLEWNGFFCNFVAFTKLLGWFSNIISCFILEIENNPHYVQLDVKGIMIFKMFDMKRLINLCKN